MGAYNKGFSPVFTAWSEANTIITPLLFNIIQSLETLSIYSIRELLLYIVIMQAPEGRSLEEGAPCQVIRAWVGPGMGNALYESPLGPYYRAYIKQA